MQPRDEEPRDYFRQIAGNDCTGVKAGLLLGLLRCGDDSCRALAGRLQARVFDAVAASGQATNSYYPPGYWLWMMFRVLGPAVAAEASSAAGARGRVVDVLRETFDRLDGKAHRSAQQAAWLVLCRSTPAGGGHVRQDWLRTLVSSQAHDGGWAAEPIYRVPTWDNRTAWHRSRLVTTAVCRRALVALQDAGDGPVNTPVVPAAILHTGPWKDVFGDFPSRLSASTGLPVTETPDGLALVYVLGWFEHRPLPCESFIPLDAIYLTHDKRKQATLFRDHGIATPESHLVATEEEALAFPRQRPDKEWILKWPVGCGGDGHQILDARTVVTPLWRPPFLVQELIRMARPRVYRLFVAGGETFNWCVRESNERTAHSPIVSARGGATVRLVDPDARGRASRSRQGLRRGRPVGQLRRRGHDPVRRGRVVRRSN